MSKGSPAALTAGPREVLQESGERTCTVAPAQPRKWSRVLRAFLDGRSFNRFEAARELRDWCLNTTISQLERRGLTMLRSEEVVQGAFGPVRCNRYRLAPESAGRARELLGIGNQA